MEQTGGLEAASEPFLAERSEEDDDDKRNVDAAKRKLLIGTALCLTFMCAEIIGGIMAHSLSIIADAAHMLSDIAGCSPPSRPPLSPGLASLGRALPRTRPCCCVHRFLVGVVSLFLMDRSADAKYTFGYYRAEVRRRPRASCLRPAWGCPWARRRAKSAGEPSRQVLGALVSIMIVWLMTGILLYEAVNRLIEPVRGHRLSGSRSLRLARDPPARALLALARHRESRRGVVTRAARARPCRRSSTGRSCSRCRWWAC